MLPTTTNQKGRTMAIEAAHYEESRQALMADPVVIEMAELMPAEHLVGLVHEDGSPTFDLMQIANQAYRERGGKLEPGHIGAVAEAVVRLITAAAA